MRGTRAMNWTDKKQGAVTYSKKQENDFSRAFIRPLRNWIELESTPRSQAVRTLQYRLLNQPITAHLVAERCDNTLRQRPISLRLVLWNDTSRITCWLISLKKMSIFKARALASVKPQHTNHTSTTGRPSGNSIETGLRCACTFFKT